MIVYPNPKINLGLNVLRKREDGFHELDTLFVPYFGLCDELEIEKSSSFSIEIEPCSWDPQQDLTARAWRLLHKLYGIGPVCIHLKKNIPVGAGLGGGSADAAFALKALSELFELSLSDARLCELAAQLGSDCPFFIYNRPMIGRGRGEVLSPYEIDLSEYEIRLLIPQGISVSTREAYAGIVPGKPLVSLEEALLQPVECWRTLLVNDFEETVFKVHPELASLKESLYRQGAVYASMSGSGSTLFGLFRK